MLYTGSSGPCRWALIQGRLTDAHTAEFVEHLREIGANAIPGQLVLDLAIDLPMPTPVQRRQIVDALEGAPGLDLVAGHALVINSSVGRGLLTAINWVVRPPFEEKVFSHPDEALGWLEERNPAFDRADLLHGVRRAYPDFDRLRW